jgi:hypothetical protein
LDIDFILNEALRDYSKQDEEMLLQLYLESQQKFAVKAKQIDLGIIDSSQNDSKIENRNYPATTQQSPHRNRSNKRVPR